MLSYPFTPEFLTQLETLRLRTRREFLGSHTGSYSSPRRGTSLEFADYRKYSPGDDLRYLDWGIYARTDRLYIKVFREEVDLFAYVFIDASASMALPSREEKYLPATHVALALAYVVLANHDHVKFHLLQDQSRAPAPHDRLHRLRYVGTARRTAGVGVLSREPPQTLTPARQSHSDFGFPDARRRLSTGIEFAACFQPRHRRDPDFIARGSRPAISQRQFSPGR